MLPNLRSFFNLKYMKKYLLLFIISFTLITPNRAFALEPKAKAFMVMATYGTVGGALLGFASMAFGGQSRSIAQGASLGLYAGIIFGAYVISSYNTKGETSYNPPPNEPPPYYDPYDQNNGQYPQDNGGFGAPVPQEKAEDSGGFFGNRILEINEEYQNFRGERKSNPLPPIYLNFFNATF